MATHLATDDASGCIETRLEPLAWQSCAHVLELGGGLTHGFPQPTVGSVGESAVEMK